MIKKHLYLLCSSIAASCYIPTAIAGIVISSTQNNQSETTIYQDGVALFLKNGKTDSIVDTKSNNCIVVNHEIKQYLRLKCSMYNIMLTKKYMTAQKILNKKIPLAKQRKMPENLVPKTAILIKRTGRGSYQGYHVEKFKFIVDNNVVTEYWVSANLKEKINKEINVEKVNKVFKVSDKYKYFKNGLNTKIENKYAEFKKKHFALKEFRYGDNSTQKIYRHIRIKNISVGDYMPPKSYKLSSSVSKFYKSWNKVLKF